MFGMYLTNGSGSQIFGDAETTFMYWGKITYGSGSPNSAQDKLFNLPNNIPMVAFWADNSKGYPQWSDGDDHCLFLDAQWTDGYVRSNLVKAVDYSGGDMHLLIFVDSRHIPIPSTGWGLSVRDSSGVLKFHTYRPILKAKWVSTGDKGTAIPTSIGFPAIMSQQVGWVENEQDMFDMYPYAWLSKYTGKYELQYGAHGKNEGGGWGYTDARDSAKQS